MKYILSLFIVLMMFTSSYSLELTKQDIYWITQNVYHESRNQKPSGQMMVALVTINRKFDKRWPNTIKGVVTQPSQFSWYWDGKSDIPDDIDAWNRAKGLSLLMVMMYDNLPLEEKKIFWFHTIDISPYWRYKVHKYTEVGRHVFYPETTGE